MSAHARIAGDVDAEVRRHIAVRLAWALRRRGLNQKDLSERSGVSRACISRAIANQRTFTAGALARVSIALDVDPAWLMGLRSLSDADATPFGFSRRVAAPQRERKDHGCER